MPNKDSDDDASLADRLRGVRETVQRKQTAVKADKRAKQRRIDLEEPDSLTEKAAVTRKRLGKATEEARGLASDTKSLAETKLDTSIDPGEAGGTIGEFVASAGEAVDSFETDALAEDGFTEPADMGGVDVVDATEVSEMGDGAAVDDPVLEADDDFL